MITIVKRTIDHVFSQKEVNTEEKIGIQGAIVSIKMIYPFWKIQMNMDYRKKNLNHVLMKY